MARQSGTKLAVAPVARATTVRAKSGDAFRTIGEVSEELNVPKHVLRFWEGKFPQLKPMKRGGGRRFYRPEDVTLLLGIHRLLHTSGYTIKGVQRIMREQGVDAVKTAAEARATTTAPTATITPPRQTKRGTQKSSALPPELRDSLQQVLAEIEVIMALARGQQVPSANVTAKARRA